jgi:gas vesicle protein
MKKVSLPVGQAFVTGWLLGVVAGLLLAPQSDRKSQEQLRGSARRAEESVHEMANTVTEGVDQALEKGREFVNDKQVVLAEAGRTVMHRERKRLSGEKKAASRGHCHRMIESAVNVRTKEN